MNPKPKRTEKHDKALTSAEKKVSKGKKTGGEFLGSKLRKIWKSNS